MTHRSLLLSLLALALLLPAALPAQQNAPQHAKAYAAAPDIPFDSAPNFIKLPAGVYLGEGIGVARNSKGNVFVYTRSGDSSRLFEFDPNGTFVREIGRGAYGFVGTRVAKFDKNGKYIKCWGQPGTGPGQFNVLHSIATDAQGNVYVGDRENRRIQVFDNDGNFKTMYLNVGAPWALCITLGAHQYLYSSNSNYPTSMDDGEVYKMELNGKIVGKFGKAGKLLKEFGTLHEIDCRNENELYVGEIGNWRVQKLTLKPAAVQSSNAR